MSNLAFYLFLSIVIGIVPVNQSSEISQSEEEVEELQNENIELEEKLGTISQDNSEEKKIDETWTLDDFKGKPSVIVFGGTYCPHCVSSIPEFEEKVYQKYQEQINIWINVVNGQDGAKFDANIPQGFNSNLDINLVEEACGYVPSWVILDEDGKKALSSCGSGKSTDEMIERIEELI